MPPEGKLARNPVIRPRGCGALAFGGGFGDLLEIAVVPSGFRTGCSDTTDTLVLARLQCKLPCLIEKGLHPGVAPA
jgi:hypothetical protein